MENLDIVPLAGFDPEIGLLLATWADGGREWRENLGLPSPEAVTWQPYPNGPSIGGILLHVVSAELYWLQAYTDGVTIDPEDPAWKYDSNLDQYLPHWPTPPAEPIEWYFNLLDDTHSRMVGVIRQRNRSTDSFERGNEVSTYRWILSHLVQHDSYHGGQAVLLHEMYKQIATEQVAT